MDVPVALSDQNNIENEEQSWETFTFWLQNLLQRLSNQNSVLLAEG